MKDVRLKSRSDIAGILESCRIVARLLNEIASKIKPGVMTKELDIWAEGYIRENGAAPAFKGYRGFPATLCISVNDEIVHGIPGKRTLVDGDLVKIDVGAILKGRFSDAAKTYFVGGPSLEAEKLVDATERSFFSGVAAISNGAYLSDVGKAIQNTIQTAGFKVIRDLTGHGVGFAQHEAPTVYNYPVLEEDMKLRNGMVLAIEPMASVGSEKIFAAADGWTLKTLDGSLAAHYEHTIAVWEGRVYVLTGGSEDTDLAEEIFGTC